MKNALLLIAMLLLLPITLAADNACNINEQCGIDNTVTNSTINKGQPTGKVTDCPACVEKICIAYFYGSECPKCAASAPFIESLESRYGDKISVAKYEISHNVKNFQTYNSLCAIRNIGIDDRGIPLVAIGNEYFMGVSEIKEKLEPKIQEMLLSGERACPLAGEEGCSYLEGKSPTDINSFIQGLKEGITIPLVVGAGLVDGINPCAFAVLIFLLAFLMEISSSKTRMIKAAAAYILAVYITYFLAGIGLLSAIQLTGASAIIVKVAAVVAIAAGLVNIKDYFWYGKGFSLKIPESRKVLIESFVKKANIPAALILGFLVSIFELPCTGGVYLAVLAMLASTATKIKAVYYLLIYNVMFVLPLIIIVIAVIKGMKAEHIENWRKARRNLMKLALGLLLLGFGIAMLLGWV